MATDFNYIGLLCLCELIKKLHYFNIRKEIATIIVRKKTSRVAQIRELANQTVNEFLKDPNPSFFEIKTIIVAAIAKICNKYPEKKLPDDFYQCLLEMDLTINVVNTYQKDYDNDVDKEELKKAKKKKRMEVEKEIQRVTKKGKKKLTFDKLRKDVLEELKEAEATVDANKLKKQKDEIVKKIFYVFFKILRNQRPSKFFDLAMKGILKYVHVISHTIIQDLLDCIREAGEILREYHLKNMNKKELVYSRLACIFTAIEINKQLEGEQIDFDEKQSVELFYLLWLDIYNHKKIQEGIEQKESTLIVKLLEKLFIQKRQMSNAIVASFIKMICLVLSKGHIHERKFVLTLLFSSRRLYSKTLL